MGNLMWFYPFLFFIVQHQFAHSTPSLSYSAQLCPSEQSIALLQFKKLFSIDSLASYLCDDNGQPPRPKTMYWNSSTDCCTWDGVTCDGLTGHVIGLDLSYSQLQGTIHSNSTLFQLSHLRSLNLACNDLSSSQISQEFGLFATTLTHLNLSGSGFSGQISSKIWHFSKLVSLDLSLNYLRIKHERYTFEVLLQNLTQLRELSLAYVDIQSVVPVNLSTSLTFLDLSLTGLHGKLPENIFQLPNLQTLKLFGNDLTGNLPKVNMSSNSPLRWLDLSDTNLHGEVPDSIGYLKSLTYLKLSGCMFSGSIPELFGNLTLITVLDLSGNNFSVVVPNSVSYLKCLNSLILNSCHFSGQIPEFLGNLTLITALDLSNNDFSGEIPPTLSNLEQLTDLDLSYNYNLEGQIPNIFANLKHLSSLSLQRNRFSGTFPSSISNLTQLVELDLSMNSLTGPIPSNIVGLHNLISVSLSDNSFNGTIPSWLFSPPSLMFLDLSSNWFTGQIHEFRSKSQERINLSNNELHGAIPQSIYELENLNTLYLSSNKLTGVVELDMFSNLTRLRNLDLSYNNLSVSTTNANINATFPNLYVLLLSSCRMKEFPELLRGSVRLLLLDLSYNQIHGQIPDWVSSMRGDSLSYLHLRSNLLQGPLPSTICNLRALEILELSNNNFSGAIPQCLGNFSDRLAVLDLRMNSFNGTILTTFAKGNKLRNLNLHGNQLEGMLPRSLVSCKHLEVLDLGNNQINDTFPQWLGTLPLLQVLVLRYNRFHGSISSSSKTKSTFSELRIIDISHNQFTGLLPSKYFRNFKAMMNIGENEVEQKYMQQPYYEKYYDYITVVIKGLEVELERILTVFTTIDLSSNRFEGEISNFIKNLSSLRGLNLSHNSLVGHIPSVLGNLFVLESLDLSCNQLVGEIPEQLTGLTFLAVLNLSQNRLVGRIPSGGQFNTFENISYSGNLALCGFPLSKICGNEATPQPPSPLVFRQKDDSDFANGFPWNVVLGYGCGTLFGLVMGYLMFLTGKPKWFTGIVEKKQHKNARRLVKRGRRCYRIRNS